MPILAGTRLGPYEILGLIGAGGMGEVYKASDTRLDRTVAIKVLPADISADPGRRARFEREAKTIASLTHPHICTLHDVGEHGGSMFLVMEHLEGETLAHLLQNGPMYLAPAMAAAIEIGEALAAAHAHGVIHRDLKPGNVMLTDSGAKLLDFGIAKVSLGAPDAETITSATSAGVIVGTPAYMSPEQLLGDPLGPRSDLFSFGVLLYQMVTGKLPFHGESQLTLVRQILHEAPPPVRTIAPGIPEDLAALVERCLAKGPEERYAGAAEVVADLRRMTAVLDAAVDEHPVLAQSVAHAARVRRLVLAVLGTLGITVSALIVVPAFVRWARPATTNAASSGAETSPQELYSRATELLRVYYRDQNVDRAIELLERAIQQKSPYPAAEARLSLGYWRRNAISPDPHWRNEARAFADRAVAGDPQLAIAHVAQGAAFVLAGDFDRAAAAYQQAFTLDPTNWELLWREGDLAIARGNTTAAEQRYRKSVDAAPREWEPRVRLGGFCYRQGRYDAALEAYTFARDLAPDHPRIYANLAAVYHQVGRTDEAAAVLQKSLEIAPDSMTYSNLGTLLYFQGRYPEALSALEQAVNRGANTYTRWGNLADAARMTPGKGDRAHEAYTRAVQLAREVLNRTPDDADARSLVALYLVRDHQLKSALGELNQVLGQQDLPPGVLFTSAVVAELAGLRPRALELLRRALDAGYQLREISAEPDLVHLRTDPEYHRMAAHHAK